MTEEQASAVARTQLLMSKIVQILVDDESGVRVETESSENGTVFGFARQRMM
jgi:hypothetical protein